MFHATLYCCRGRPREGQGWQGILLRKELVELVYYVCRAIGAADIVYSEECTLVGTYTHTHTHDTPLLYF